MGISSRLYFIPLACIWLLLPLVPHAETVKPDEAADKPSDLEQDKIQLGDEVRRRELGAEEDPLARQQAKHVETPEAVIAEPDKFRLYGSVRIRYRDTDSGSFWGDGGSRFGLSGRWQFRPETWLFGRGEAGLNLLDTADLLFNRGDRPPDAKLGDEVFLRLLYLGIETPDIMLTAGKNCRPITVYPALLTASRGLAPVPAVHTMPAPMAAIPEPAVPTAFFRPVVCLALLGPHLF